MSKQPITVAHVVGGLDPGGAETLLIDLLRAMLPFGYRFKVFYMVGKGTLRGEIEKLGIETEFLDIPSEKQFWKMPEVAIRLRKSHSQIVHLHVHISRYWLTPAAWLGGARAVFQTLHDTYQHKPAGLRYVRALEKINLHLATAEIAVSERVRDFFVHEFRLPTPKLLVIYNGVRPTLDQSTPVDRAMIGLAVDDFAIATVANLTVRKKGYEILLPAFYEIKKNLPAAKLLIMGEGALRPWMENWIAEHGLENSIRLLGLRADVRHLLPLFDLFVLPSLWEGMPISIIEAMFAGLPIVTTEVGGNLELLDLGRSGVLVPPADPQALCKAILALAADRQRMQHLGSMARERAHAHFTIERMAQQIHALYRQTLSRQQVSE